MATSSRIPLLPALAALGLTACVAKDDSSAPPRTTLTARFDDSTGAPPPGWRLGTSNASGSQDATWEVRVDPTAPSPPNTLGLWDAHGHVGQQFNLCWMPEVALADVDVTVAVRADGGEEDQGGGPAWRIAGANDYYLARWNPLEDNFRVYSVRRGQRLQLDSARVRVDPAAWHTIRVRHVGDAITCWFDGDELLHATDATIPEAGAVGLWTKADATTRFDDLVAGPAR